MRDITLTFPEPVYEQLRSEAERANQSVENLLIQTIIDAYPTADMDSQHLNMLREVSAFEAQHSNLIQTYAGMYVAMLNGQVIDSDSDLDTLAIRIEETYPNEVVLMQLVESTLPPVLRLRSPRLVRE